MSQEQPEGKSIDFATPPAGGVFMPTPSEPESEEVRRDPSHTVPGLDAAPPAIVPEVEESGPTVGGRVDLDEGPQEDLESDQETEPGADPPAQSQQIQLCPNCGWDCGGTLQPYTPSEEDKRAWISHILGEPRFRKTYELYGGMVMVTLRSRTQAEDDAAFAQLDADVKSGSLPEGGTAFLTPEYGHRMHSYFMAFSIEQVASKDGKVALALPDEPLDPVKDSPANDALEKLKAGVSEGLYLNLIEVQRHFETTIRTLVVRGSDPNFWEPIGG